MRLSHARPQAHDLRRDRLGRRRGERGYVLAKFALLLIPLLLMTGLSVDVGSWYGRISDIQKAADAAALAGVVWLPDTYKADQFARAAATKNGFTHNPNDPKGIKVYVDPIPGQNRRLKVTIVDGRVGSYLWQNLGGKPINVGRSATAEYVLPVPLGSPDNVFGTDVDLPVAQRMNLWGNIHGPKTDGNKGDAFSPECRGSEPCGSSSDDNPDARTSGYLYTIDVPTGVTGLAVQVYDAGLFPRQTQATETGDANYRTETNGQFDLNKWNSSSSGRTTTRWTMYALGANASEIVDNPIATTSLCNGTRSPTWTSSAQGGWTISEARENSNFKNRWATICTKNGTVDPGRYTLRVQTSGNGAGANRYSVRATATSTTKPRIAAYGDMSMYNNISSGVANFYLAEVGPEHRGKTLEVRLYDPGEVSGNAFMQINKPGDVAAPSCKGMHGGTAGEGRFASGTTLTPCRFQTAPEMSPEPENRGRYDGLWVTLQIPIPNDYTCTLGAIPGCWWKIRYEIGAQASDTTTWAANVIGDPVHLVEDEAP